ncbi:MAG: c-type cytochrome domain-containing protein, partial [Planctomycetaceae bacterium]
MRKHDRHTLAGYILCVLFGSVVVAADEPASFDALSTEYERDVRPLLKRFCLKCHSSEKKDGELDLQRFASLAEVRRGTRVWSQVAEMLDNGEMPPEESEQPSVEQR